MKRMTMLKFMRRLGCMTAIWIAALVLAWPAQADMILKITDANNPSDTVSIDDSGTGNAAHLFSSLGNYTINFITVIANYDGNTFGHANLGDAYLQLAANVTQSGTKNGTSDSLIVSITTSGSSSWSTPSGSPVLLSSTLAVSGFVGSGSSASFASTLSSGATSTTVTAPTAFSAVTTTNSGNAPNPSPPFYLSDVLTINTNGKNHGVNLGAMTDAVSSVPEPSTGILTIAGALLMFALGWRFRHSIM
jgi:hypothetical protein